MKGILRVVAFVLLFLGYGTFVTTHHFIGERLPLFQFYEIPEPKRIIALLMLISGLILGLAVRK